MGRAELLPDTAECKQWIRDRLWSAFLYPLILATMDPKATPESEIEWRFNSAMAYLSDPPELAALDDGFVEMLAHYGAVVGPKSPLLAYWKRIQTLWTEEHYKSGFEKVTRGIMNLKKLKLKEGVTLVSDQS
jgi:hypothetical protein